MVDFYRYDLSFSHSEQNVCDDSPHIMFSKQGSGGADRAG